MNINDIIPSKENLAKLLVKDEFAKIGDDDMGAKETDEETLPEDDEDLGKEEEDPYHEIARDNTMSAVKMWE